MNINYYSFYVICAITLDFNHRWKALWYFKDILNKTNDDDWKEKLLNCLCVCEFKVISVEVIDYPCTPNLIHHKKQLFSFYFSTFMLTFWVSL